MNRIRMFLAVLSAFAAIVIGCGPTHDALRAGELVVVTGPIWSSDPDAEVGLVIVENTATKNRFPAAVGKSFRRGIGARVAVHDLCAHEGGGTLSIAIAKQK